MTDICPTCGREYPPDIVIRGTVRKRIFDSLAKHPNGLNIQQLMDCVYGDRIDGGPESPNILWVVIRQLNLQLAPKGWTIEGSGGPGSVYVLMPLAKRQRRLRKNSALRALI